MEYTRIVGSDDGGVPFSPEEYEKYKKQVLPMRMQNRIFVSWTNSKGMDCVLIGPETMCFCRHRFKQHQSDFKEISSARPLLLPCKDCPCSSFTYVPKNGSQSIRCGCKHLSDEHHFNKPFNCLKTGCKCSSFKSSFTCNCGEPCYSHQTLAETKKEREDRGHPVGHDTMYQAMGGLTGFSSLADGYMRLDPSGIGKPSDDKLNLPITHDDHPFLRQYEHTQLNSSESGQSKSQGRQPGESELDYYERRYKEKQKSGRFK